MKPQVEAVKTMFAIAPYLFKFIAYLFIGSMTWLQYTTRSSSELIYEPLTRALIGVAIVECIHNLVIVLYKLYGKKKS
ncbi:hypothetical protein DFP98_10344 [Cohnella phaseoli]|uniref:Uncharacterized protein n=1 Tax=Cohnella phaseoli TaxID=456490 RepID=A0A3D9KKT5_9BACL|nr:hypothetical protein DFP98_10344 [Cohnella phaseoli]